MDQSLDYYAVLGLDADADQALIRAKWKALLQRYHPDINRGADVTARAQAINEAYSVLGKKETRAAYDRSRRPASSRQPEAPSSGPAPSAARRPMRHRPSARPSGSYSEQRDGGDWMTGLLLLLLTAAPLGMILVLYSEEASSRHSQRHVAHVHRAG